MYNDPLNFIDALKKELDRKENPTNKCKRKLEALRAKAEKQYLQCVNNKKFKRPTTEAKKEWYRKYLHQRIFRKTVPYAAFAVIEECLTQILPKAIDQQFSYFADVRDLKCVGDTKDLQRLDTYIKYFT